MREYGHFWSSIQLFLAIEVLGAANGLWKLPCSYHLWVQASAQIVQPVALSKSWVKKYLIISKIILSWFNEAFQWILFRIF